MVQSEIPSVSHGYHQEGGGICRRWHAVAAHFRVDQENTAGISDRWSSGDNSWNNICKSETCGGVVFTYHQSARTYPAICTPSDHNNMVWNRRVVEDRTNCILYIYDHAAIYNRWTQEYSTGPDTCGDIPGSDAVPDIYKG